MAQDPRFETHATFLIKESREGLLLLPPPPQLFTFHITLSISQKGSTDIVSLDLTTILRRTFYNMKKVKVRNSNYAQCHSTRILLGFEPTFPDSHSKPFHVSSCFILSKRGIFAHFFHILFDYYN